MSPGPSPGTLLDVVAVLCALGSSLLYAFASVLQHRGAIEQPAEQSLKLGLLVRLLRHRTWLLGLLCDGGAYVLQFIALGQGAIAVVQPLLVCGLLFALPIGAMWAGRRLTRVDWIGAVMVCVGLAVFLAVADPAKGKSDTGTLDWAIMLTSVAAVTGVLVYASLGADSRRRALYLSAAAGVVYGAAAALTKTAAHLLSKGVVPLLVHWPAYVLVVFGVGGMVLAQSAFQAGALDLSLPMMSVGDPVVSVIIGASILQESVASRPVDLTLELLFTVVMTVGVYLLGRSEAQMSKAESHPV